MNRIIRNTATEVDRTRPNGGNTFLFLVIAIAILLILTSAIIATLAGENGIIIKAQEASEQNSIAGYMGTMGSMRLSLQYLTLGASIFNEEEYLERLEGELLEDNDIEEEIEEILESEDIELATENDYILCLSEDKINYAGTNNNIVARPPNA